MSLNLATMSWLAFSFGWLLVIVSGSRVGRNSSPVTTTAAFVTQPAMGRLACVLLIAWLVGPAIALAVLGATPMAYRETANWGTTPSSFAMILDYLNTVGYGGVVLFVAMPSSMARRYSLKPLFLLGLAIHVLFIMGGGAKLPIILLLLSIAMGFEIYAVSGQGSRRSLRIAYLTMFLGGAFAFQVIGPYRVLANRAFAAGLPQNPVERVRAQVGIFSDAVLVMVGSADSEEIRRTADVATKRLSSLSALCRVLGFLGGTPAYDNIRTIPLVPLYAILPRDMVETKVTYIQSGDFAHLNGWKFGGLSVTLPGSLYWTAGYAGVIVGFVFYGILYSWMWRRALSHRRNAGVYMVFSILIGLLLWEPGWDAMIISSERYAIILFGIYAIVSIGRIPLSPGNGDITLASRP
jgi:hypothetical protein